MGERVPEVTVRPGGEDDVWPVLALLDGATRWLVAQGRVGQWGTEPHSTNPRRIATVTGWAREGGLYLALAGDPALAGDLAEAGDLALAGDLAEAGDPALAGDLAEAGDLADTGGDVRAGGDAGAGGHGAPVGAIAVGTAPVHVPPAGEPELYINLLVTDRAYAGSGIGRRLLDHARQLARERGVGLLRVDCYAGGDRKLVRYNQREGFTATDTFEVALPDRRWPGQVLAQRITPG